LWRRIITDLELEVEDDLARRRELRNILQRRLFFRGRQFDWWSETDGQYFAAGVKSTALYAIDNGALHALKKYQPTDQN
jgi:hypothetical protein